MAAYIMVLNDDETFTDVHGCTIYEVPDNPYVIDGIDAVEEALSAGRLKVVQKISPTFLSVADADPLMREIMEIIKDRGELSEEDIRDFFDAANDDELHDPNWLYQSQIAPGVNEIEDIIKSYIKNREEE